MSSSNYGEVAGSTRFNKSIGFDKQSLKNVKTGAGEVVVSDENYSQREHSACEENLSTFKKPNNDYIGATRNSAIIKGQDTATLEPTDFIKTLPVETSPLLNLKINVHEKDTMNKDLLKI